jgi:acyl carrier protein
MVIASRTPEGDGYLCPICGKRASVAESFHNRDVPCASCGHLLQQIHDRLGLDGSHLETLRLSLDKIGKDSLELVVLIMEFEEEFEIAVPDHEAESCRTIADVVRMIQRYRRDGM